MLQSAGIGIIASVADAAEASTVLRRIGADAVVVSALTCQAGVSNTRKIVALVARGRSNPDRRAIRHGLVTAE